MKLIIRQNLYGIIKHNSKGFSLIDVLIALALLGIIGVTFLVGLATAFNALAIANEETIAESLARSKMEDVKNQEYDYTDPQSYEQDYEVATGYPGYQIKVDVERLDPENEGSGDHGIQKITVFVNNNNSDNDIVILEDYKVDR